MLPSKRLRILELAAKPRALIVLIQCIQRGILPETWLEAPVRNFENVAESCFYKCFFSILLMDFGQTLLEAHTCVKHKPSI